MRRRVRRLLAAATAGACVAALAGGAGPAAAGTSTVASADLSVTADIDDPREFRTARVRGVRYSVIDLNVLVDNDSGSPIPRDAFEVRIRLSRTVRPAHYFRWVPATPANRGNGGRYFHALRFVPAPDRSLPRSGGSRASCACGTCSCPRPPGRACGGASVRSSRCPRRWRRRASPRG